MADSSEDAPLATGSLAGSEEALVQPATIRGGSNSRALKVAGLTVLTCLLLASQVFTAYMVISQKQQIHSLQKNSDRMSKQMIRSVQVPMKMHMPMHSLPLMMDVALDDTEPSNTPPSEPKSTSLDKPEKCVEKQVKEFLHESKLPKFNSTFLDNLYSLEKQLNQTAWKSFRSWLLNWLIFHMALEKHPHPTPDSVMTKCQVEAAISSKRLGDYKPQCDEQGRYKPMQCWHSTGFCWCVDKDGNRIEKTTMRGQPKCQRGRMLGAPMMPLKILADEE
ncbi:CD74 molecule, major histocompatibility complex, class II invariant chain a isoform X2 [Thalassophryne amazonica]|uniref:CD74 molecule, major histocompatibility complex, class II invariant chain a isoform X2 n=1 Tax=Thalassophryne amazonica TaxID=390379 RepID=UPI0014724B55|nr:CD74 molecule, major histocompatibility complex, class II invariant chain a isoform X2 [Thalassophryne amazonica]